MAQKKDIQNPTLPEEARNNIVYANDVVTTIAGLAVAEVEGIAGMCSAGGGLLKQNRAGNKGVKVEIGPEEAAVDVYVVVEYGTPIQKACLDVQENVRKAIESMTGLHVVRVDVHVQNVSFEKENSALQAGQNSQALSSGIETDKAETENSEPDNDEKSEESDPE